MLKKRTMRHVALLLFFLLITFQLMSGVYMSNSYSSGDMYNPSSLQSQKVNHIETSACLFTEDWPKIKFDAVSAELYGCLVEKLYYIEGSESTIFYRKELPDCRKQIKKAIQNHFHGSKYKEGSLVI